ncbi:endopeptidase La [Spiroplasma endosymbiont of Amphibalanus improvisus]|uniref:endopeptidase La n=1 Tax=Spiroplasma endosymbiont of Amphibalanus improvisus TaxID=3066327 RepID=UPI00313C31E9
MGRDDNQIKTKDIPILVTRGSFIYPGFEQVLEVGRDKSVNAIKTARSKFDSKMVLVSQINPLDDDVSLNDIFKVGVLVQFVIRREWEDGSFTVNFKALERVKILDLKDEDYYYSDIKVLESKVKSDEVISDKVAKNLKEYISDKQTSLPDELLDQIGDSVNGSNIVDTIAQFQTFLSIDKRQKILEELNVDKRLDLVFDYLLATQQNQDIDNRIAKKIQQRVDDQQKEFYLREKLKAIKDELSDISDENNDLKKYKTKLEKNPYPKYIKERVLSEIKRYEQLPQSSSEANIIRTYIDWMMALPWFELTEVKYNLAFAKKTLDKHHWALTKVKERIIEYLAAQSMTKSQKGSIICLLGPPGVGKTSLAKSIAEATGRNFVKVSLGGVKDESEIRGHRKTYIGAMPGRIIQMMKKAKSKNPLFLLDEIDKMSSDYRGDPASALLEVLDPEQNKDFSDHYIEENYDLSQVMFLATANYYENIPEALYDRMEIINLSSYTELEKHKIANKYLVPKVLVQNGLADGQLKFDKSSIDELIKHYTREAGVRHLERCLNSIARKFIVKLLKKEIETLVVDTKIVHKFLGKRVYEHTDKQKKADVGVVTGLAYTQFGGDILPIEVNHFKGKGNLILTGKLGDVMKESASIALDYVKSNAKLFKIDEEIFENLDIHIHVPEGAVPKDGPSAGITLTTAIISSLTGKPVSKDLGMTGEITLNGHVLPIGGLREKSISANRSGLSQILIPSKNTKDLDDIPKEVKSKLKIVPVSDYHEVYKVVFGNNA